MILLGAIVERVSGEPLDRFGERRIFTPLGMGDTCFRPGTRLLAPRARTVTAARAYLYSVDTMPPEKLKAYVVAGDEVETAPAQHDVACGWVLVRFKGKTATSAGLMQESALE